MFLETKYAPSTGRYKGHPTDLKRCSACWQCSVATQELNHFRSGSAEDQDSVDSVSKSSGRLHVRQVRHKFVELEDVKVSVRDAELLVFR